MTNTSDKEILFNLALMDVIEFCKEQNIDCSGSHLVKDGRGYEYTLVRSVDSRPIASVTFHKSSVPTHRVWSHDLELSA